jgi:branched-chain amino acid transport system substrate-binding protein
MGASPLKIGVGEMLTGPSAYYGNAVLQGVQVSLDRLNSHGGVLGQKIELQVLDDASDNTQSVNIVRKFAEDGSIPVAIAPTYQPNFEASCAVANQQGLPVLGAQSAPPPAAQNPKGYCYVVTSDLFAQVKDAIKTVHEKKGVTSFAVVYDQTNAYVTRFSQVTVQDIKDAGLKVSENIAVVAGQTDYGPQITRLLSSKPEAIFPAIVTEDAARFMQQARAAGVKALFFDPASELTNKRIFDLSKGAAEGVIAATPQSIAEPSFKGFVAAYEKKFGPLDDPTYSGFGYDALLIAAKAMEIAKTTSDRAAIKKALDGMTSFCGSICFQNDGHGNFLTSKLYYVKLTQSGYVPAGF